LIKNVFYIEIEVGDSNLIILSSFAATPTGFNLGFLIFNGVVLPSIATVFVRPLASSESFGIATVYLLYAVFVSDYSPSLTVLDVIFLNSLPSPPPLEAGGFKGELSSSKRHSH